MTSTLKRTCRCGCKNCLCEHPVIKQVVKNKKKQQSISSSPESFGNETYSDPYYYYKTETPTAAYDSSKPKPQYPFSVNVRPNLYYDEAATYSNESDNIYYKITEFDDKIKNFIIGRLSYTKNRDYFEKVEKLRFRLPTADQMELKSEAPACVIDRKVDELHRFREKYSDECMGARVQRETADKHTCVHLYHLNDRRFPQPSLTDEDGNSLCSSCYTASNYMMENNVNPLNCEKRFVIPGKADAVVSRGNQEDAPILVLEAPKAGHSTQKFFSGPGKRDNKHVPFPNSLALRFQPRKLC